MSNRGKVFEALISSLPEGLSAVEISSKTELSHDLILRILGEFRSVGWVNWVRGYYFFKEREFLGELDAVLNPESPEDWLAQWKQRCEELVATLREKKESTDRESRYKVSRQIAILEAVLS